MVGPRGNGFGQLDLSWMIIVVLWGIYLDEKISKPINITSPLDPQHLSQKILGLVSNPSGLPKVGLD